MAELGHPGSRVGVVAGGVTDHQRRRTAGEDEGVVPVPADLDALAGWDVTGDQAEPECSFTSQIDRER